MSSRTQNAFRNMVFGIVLKAYQTVVPFFMRTIMIYTLGVQYLGLNSLFASVLQVLNLAELGISQAMTFCMYRPIVQKDKKQICELLRLYRGYYFAIGSIILAVGVLLMPFLPLLIRGNVPGDINIYVLYVIQLAVTVTSYWLFSYRSSLLEAHQRNDLISKIQLITFTVQFILQMTALWIWKNYYAYVLVQLLVQMIQQCLIYIFVKTYYPEYRPSRRVNASYRKDITNHVKDLATAKFGSVILNSGDSIVISAFLGLSVLAIYQNYFYLITAVVGFLSSVLYAALAGVGNSMLSETKEKVYQDFKQFTFIISWLVCVCTTCFFCMFQPFMKIWVGSELMLNFSMVILLCLYFYVYEYNQLFNLYKDAAGLWHKDRFRPLVTASINLILNIIFVQTIGLYGVVLSTILSICCVGMPWLLHHVFDALFSVSISEYIKILLRYAAITVGSCVLSHLVLSRLVLGRYMTFLVSFFVAFGVSNLMYLAIFRNRDEFRKCIEMLRRVAVRKK